MKIIGKNADGWIVDISEDELANLTGYYSHYSNVDGYKKPAIGDIVQVSKMYHKLHEMADADKRIQEYARSIEKYFEILRDPLSPFKEFGETK
jgi:hypothetical protein